MHKTSGEFYECFRLFFTRNGIATSERKIGKTTNLVPRVLRLFGQRLVTRRDSGEFEKVFFGIACSVTSRIILPQKSSCQQNSNTRESPLATNPRPKSVRTLGTRLASRRYRISQLPHPPRKKEGKKQQNKQTKRQRSKNGVPLKVVVCHSQSMSLTKMRLIRIWFGFGKVNSLTSRYVTRTLNRNIGIIAVHSNELTSIIARF